MTANKSKDSSVPHIQDCFHYFNSFAHLFQQTLFWPGVLSLEEQENS